MDLISVLFYLDLERQAPSATAYVVVSVYFRPHEALLQIFQVDRSLASGTFERALIVEAVLERLFEAFHELVSIIVLLAVQVVFDPLLLSHRRYDTKQV